MLALYNVDRFAVDRFNERVKGSATTLEVVKEYWRAVSMPYSM